MSDTLPPGVGAVPSADIAVPEHERELRFYARVLGTGEAPLWREDLMNALGQPVIGLGEHSEEYAHLPLQWMPHIQVADVARSVELALEAGGSELMHGKGDDGASLWAVLLDPNGAAFGIIPAAPPDAPPSGEEGAAEDAQQRAGSITWLELTVSDASATSDFYRRVVGWRSRPLEMEDQEGRYTDHDLFGEEGRPIAGVRHGRGANLDLPPVWMLCLPVGDFAESLRRVQQEGGKVVKTVRGLDGERTRAVIQDPVGVHFALVPG